MTDSRHIILVAGEASGDRHSARLVEALKDLNPQLTFSGLGGQEMEKAGVRLDEDLTRMAVVGFVEVLKHYFEIKRCFNLILEKIRTTKPAAVILVDYPGFNLRLAKAIRELGTGTKIIYYISPQVWAWDEGRVEAIKKNTDLFLVLFPFEKTFFAKHGLDVTCVGHPLAENLPAPRPAPGPSPTVGLLPGSRQKEIERILPVMIEAARILHDKMPEVQFVLIKAPTVESSWLDRWEGRVIENQRDLAVQACDACLVTSGTATLETAVLGSPMVVVYKTSFFTWALARMLIRIPYIGLVNVVAGKQIVPECIQFEATGARLAAELQKILTDPLKAEAIRRELDQVRTSLGAPGASRRAAEAILSFLSLRKGAVPGIPPAA